MVIKHAIQVSHFKQPTIELAEHLGVLVGALVQERRNSRSSLKVLRKLEAHVCKLEFRKLYEVVSLVLHSGLAPSLRRGRDLDRRRARRAEVPQQFLGIVLGNGKHRAVLPLHGAKD